MNEKERAKNTELDLLCEFRLENAISRTSNIHTDTYRQYTNTQKSGNERHAVCMTISSSLKKLTYPWMIEQRINTVLQYYSTRNCPRFVHFILIVI